MPLTVLGEVDEIISPCSTAPEQQMPPTILCEVDRRSSDASNNDAPETKPAPKRVPPAAEAHEGEQFYACIICNRQLRLGDAPDDLVDGVFCQSFGNPSSGEHDFTRSHEIAEFAICDACWRGAMDFGAVRCRSLLQRVFLCNLREKNKDYQLRQASFKVHFGEPGNCTEAERASMLDRGYIGVYKTIRVTDGAELLEGGGWRLPSGQVIKPH